MAATPRKALILTADRFEDLEVLVPKARLEEAGWTVDVAAPRHGNLEGEHGYTVRARYDLDEVEPGDYHLLVLPGGPPEGGAGTVRRYRSARRVAQHFMEEGKPVAAICHGPYTLVSAGVLEGRRLTSVDKDGVPDEIRDEGATWEDAEVVVDGNLVTSRTPEDLPAFTREMMKLAERPLARPAKGRAGSRKGKGKGRAKPAKGANGLASEDAEPLVHTSTDVEAPAPNGQARPAQVAPAA
ncbi:MAG TPA: type 1 glutamine amidotransferase domain-containing protein [Candidatus Thermoplasmatota archaeon]|nr:type 1 glutamine amidotransferase domain-containing protein [Candidatus Thermoplasmatota archaeon]